jgi:hypothetical protein
MLRNAVALGLDDTATVIVLDSDPPDPFPHAASASEAQTAIVRTLHALLRLPVGGCFMRTSLSEAISISLIPIGVKTNFPGA